MYSQGIHCTTTCFTVSIGIALPRVPVKITQPPCAAAQTNARMYTARTVAQRMDKVFFNIVLKFLQAVRKAFVQILVHFILHTFGEWHCRGLAPSTH